MEQRRQARRCFERAWGGILSIVGGGCWSRLSEPFNLCSSWRPRSIPLQFGLSFVIYIPAYHMSNVGQQLLSGAQSSASGKYWHPLAIFCRCIVRVGNNHIPPALFVLLWCYVCRCLTFWIQVDLLKTRMQQGDGSLRLPTWGYLPPCRSMLLHSCFSWLLTVVPISRSHSSVILGTIRGVITTDGIKGLWRGTSPSLIR